MSQINKIDWLFDDRNDRNAYRAFLTNALMPIKQYTFSDAYISYL